MARTRVLYIAGTGRSGSTVLAGILGEVPGFFAAGELRYLWQRGMAEDRLCGCGARFSACPVWTRVMAAAGPLDREAMLTMLAQVGRMRHLPAALAGRLDPRLDAARSGASAGRREMLGRLYAAIAGVTGCDVVVDSSKLPMYARLLAGVPGIDLRVVHLIRDPRGAAHSWSSKKRLEDGAARSHMEQIGPAKSAALWDVWNMVAAASLDGGRGSYLRLRYEDFVADPATTLERILAVAAAEGRPLPLRGPREVVLGANHMVAGNPDRLRHGAVELRPDNRWLTAMSRRDRDLVTGITAPLLLRYGYALRPEAGGGDADPVPSPLERAPLDETAAGRTMRRIRRHVHWARTEGLGRVVEEDELNPARRLRVAQAKRRWRRAHAIAAGSAMPVFLVGLQRSGTNMLARGLDAAPEIEVRNENDREAFANFRLRSDDIVREIVQRSGHRFVLFKPLCDSHRVDDLLSTVHAVTPGRAIWAYRDVDGRTRSALSKYGANNLHVVRDIAAGRTQGMWQAERLPQTTLEAIKDLASPDMTPSTAAALFWWARNSLYFDLGLDRRDDVVLSSYNDLLADPVRAMRSLCHFLGLEYRAALVAHVVPRPQRPVHLDIDAPVRELCDQLQARLDECLSQQRERLAA